PRGRRQPDPHAGAGGRRGARGRRRPLRRPADPGGGMSMNDTIPRSAPAQAAALAAGEITSEDLTCAHLDRIRAVDTDLNAFLHVSEEEALTTARDVDARRSAGEELHPLAGVPIAVKDRSEER